MTSYNFTLCSEGVHCVEDLLPGMVMESNIPSVYLQTYLVSIHKSLLLPDVQQLSGHIMLTPQLVLDSTPRQADYPTTPPRHLSHTLGPTQAVNQLIQGVGGEVGTQLLQLLQQLFPHLQTEKSPSILYCRHKLVLLQIELSFDDTNFLQNVLLYKLNIFPKF